MFFQAEDGIRDLVRSRGLGDVYKRQDLGGVAAGAQLAGETGVKTAIMGKILEALNATTLSLIHI